MNIHECFGNYIDPQSLDFVLNLETVTSDDVNVAYDY